MLKMTLFTILVLMLFMLCIAASGATWSGSITSSLTDANYSICAPGLVVCKPPINSLDRSVFLMGPFPVIASRIRHADKPGTRLYTVVIMSGVLLVVTYDLADYVDVKLFG